MVREGSIRMMTVMMLFETSGPVRHVLNQIPAIHHFIRGLQKMPGMPWLQLPSPASTEAAAAAGASNAGI